ncbi:MAG: FecR family protein, partial [Sphingobacteriaceae bacterium]
MDERTRREFLERYSKNQHTEQEHELFIKWLESLTDDEADLFLEQYGQFFRVLDDSNEPAQHVELRNKIEAQLHGFEAEEEQYVIRPRFPYKWVASVAAAILLFITVGIYLNNSTNAKNATETQVSLNKISPGSNKAVLTLANGTEILLDDAKNGTLANQHNITVDKAADGKLVYNVSAAQVDAGNSSSEYNTIATPNGGQYQVVLPDGTHVWLNAGSSLKFPVAFTGKERHVELAGEAYFEVAKNKAKPFKVSVNNSVVEVLGTHFNVMGYKDEKSTNTTLLEGSVKIVSGNQQKLIVPGEQARVDGNIKVAKVKVAEAIAWKDGKFNFAHQDLKTILRKVARWYNVEIDYQGAVTNEGFVGTVPRSENITEVLNTLELTGLVHFKVEGRRVIVMP